MNFVAELTSLYFIIITMCFISDLNTLLSLSLYTFPTPDHRQIRNYGTRGNQLNTFKTSRTKQKNGIQEHASYAIFRIAVHWCVYLDRDITISIRSCIFIFVYIKIYNT